MLQIKS
jgi:TetR/AcrR family transcriptional repressor of nem operon